MAVEHILSNIGGYATATLAVVCVIWLMSIISHIVSDERNRKQGEILRERYKHLRGDAWKDFMPKEENHE